ncbi:predicted protein [Bathycoccus prasinos]|uniref:Uncharacterized protein n=1 Tax=Bathycoccus prasinos TaxID=41875 RepID=K8EYK6_9CHLO|nr:predicted protein [Bathycoccus prasinos]CCO17580.1 predicted protein [Bathycoccus prasinos]|eukprot:XP_007511459.1 predicted protein [Bathycoccus prasinos]
MTSEERQRVREEEEDEETPRTTESLSKRLVRTVCRSSSVSLEEREYLERFANRILRSTLTTTTTKTNAFLVDDDTEDEYSILDKIKDRVRDRKGFDVAVDVARLHERLHADEAWHRSVGKKREIFQLLWKLRREEEDEEEDGSEGEEDKGQKYFDSPARTVKEEEDDDDGYYGLQTPGRDHHRTTRRGRSATVERLLANDTFGPTTTALTSSGGERRARSRKSKKHKETLATMARALTPSHRHKMISPSTAAVSSPVGGPRDDAFNRLALERRRNGEVAESKLVRDCIFACNGIDGNYIKFDLVNDAYVIFPKDAPIAPGRRHACRKICELGWLYRKVKSTSDAPTSAFAKETEGATRSAFRSALSNELSKHYKMLAVLEAKVQNNNDDISEAEEEDDEANNIVLLNDRSFDSLATTSHRSGRHDRNGSNGVISDPIAPTGSDVVTLRRLLVWLDEPKRIMRALAIVCDAVEHLRGGSLLAELYRHSDTGDVVHDGIIRRVLAKTAKPYFEAMKEWCARGDSSFKSEGTSNKAGTMIGEFFVQRNDRYYRHRNKNVDSVHATDKDRDDDDDDDDVEAINRWYRFDSDDEIVDDGRLPSSSVSWKSGFVIDESSKPFFISSKTANETLKCGAAIAFLKNACKDEKWGDASRTILKHFDEFFASLSTSTASTAFTSDDENSFEKLVKMLPDIISNAKRVADSAVRESLFEHYRLKAHFVALKQYLLLGQGDFIHALMESIHDELDKEIDPMSREGISQYSLRGNLDAAVRVSNACLADQHVIDALSVRLMKPLEDETGWDVFSLEYKLRAPLTTIFSDREMGRYSRAFTFLWKLKRAEYTLCELWKAMKPTVSSRFQREGLGGNIGKALEVEQARCHRVRQSMHALISDVQYYVMFEVLEPSWNEFECKLSHNAANDDLDSIIAGHENYLNSVIEKALLGTKSQVLQRSLQLIFDSVQKFKSHTFKLYEAIEDASRVRKSDQRRIVEREMNQQWGVDFGESKEGEDYLSEDFVTGAKESLDSIENEFQKHVDGFLKLLPLQTHVDTSFLSFRLEATFRQGA